jgi:LacI family transcriptional regulator
MKKKISIKDIAAQLNISITTVSLILNGKSKQVGLSEAQTERVLKYVEEIGYKPNMLAKSLRTGKTKIICLLIEDIADPFFSTVAAHVEELLNQHGYKIIYGSTKNQTAKAIELIDLFRDRHVDGFIICPPEGLESDITGLLNEHIPLVLFDRYYKTIDTDTVIVDNLESSCNAVNYLIEHNYKNIGFVTLDSEQTQMQDRLQGYEKAIADHGFTPYIKKLSFSKVNQTGIDDIVQFLTENPQIDALFFGTNYLTLKGIEAIDRLELSIPGNMGVISFDDHDVFKLFKPGITAMAQPISQISEQMVNLLLEQIDNTEADRKRKKIIVPAIIKIRQSSVTKTDN